MPQIETEGIVLRTYNLSDADRIVVVLTKGHGLIRGVANGAKRLKSKFHSSLEFFSRIHLNCFQKEERELVTIRETELIESVFNKLSDPVLFESFAEMADLLIKFTPPNEPNERLFNMTGFCIKAGISDVSGIASVRVYFEIWLLKLGGFLPDWSACGLCGAAISDDQESGLTLDFRAQCKVCGAGVKRISTEARFLFQQAQRKSPESFAALADKKGDSLKTLGEIVSGITDAVLDRIPSEDYLTDAAQNRI